MHKLWDKRTTSYYTKLRTNELQVHATKIDEFHKHNVK